MSSSASLQDGKGTRNLEREGGFNKREVRRNGLGFRVVGLEEMKVGAGAQSIFVLVLRMQWM